MNNEATPEREQPDELAKIGQGAEAGGLNVRGSSHRKQSAEPAQRQPGALVAMRKSGGLHFSWRLVVVHQDGRIIYKSNTIGAPAAAQVVGRLNDAQQAELQRLIAGTAFAARPLPGGPQNPDAFAYEIIAWQGDRQVFAEVLDGRIPATFVPLIARLNQLIPGAEATVDADESFF